MSPTTHNDYDNEDLSGSEGDEVLDEDLEALRRACILSGTNPDDYDNRSLSLTVVGACSREGAPDSASDDDDDLKLVRSIRDRFSISAEEGQPLSLKPLSTLPPVTSDEEEDDFETLRAIQQRFAAYGSDTFGNDIKESLRNPEQLHAFDISSRGESFNKLFVDRNKGSGNCPNSEDIYDSSHFASGNVEHFSASTECQQSNACRSSTLPLRKSSLPGSAIAFVDAIKKNRSFQKFLRNMLIHLEARIEKNRKLKERFKILKDFQVSCKKRTGRALSEKKDPRVQLISVQKSGTSKESSKDKKASAMYYGPVENSHVANYRTALEKFPLSLDRKKWSKAEKENLEKGIRQQFQEMVLQISLDRFSCHEGSTEDPNDFDNILALIKDLDITPEKIREFLPKVNWDRLASMYVVGRSGAECEARWLNFEDPLINHNPWTAQEDKNLLFIIQQKGINNWFDIAVSLGTNRTPFQCLTRYQRSLNASILKREWTKDEDDELRSAVESFGEGNWQAVASVLEGRNGPQCSNRWRKSLHPALKRKGPFTPDEDKRLKMAVMLSGPKNWNKKAQFLPGRNQVQCRERWSNCLDPSLKRGEWTEEEDSRLEVAMKEHGYSWAKVATCVPPRTDSECRRRWKKLFPEEVPLLQEAKRIQKAALISNFVDRESERPALGPSDFRPLTITNMICGSEDVNPSVKGNKKSRGRESIGTEKSVTCNITKKNTSRKPRKQANGVSGEVDIGSKKSSMPKKLKKSQEMTANLSGGIDNFEKEKLPEIGGDCVVVDIKKQASKKKNRISKFTEDQNSTESSRMSMLSEPNNDAEHCKSCPDSTLMNENGILQRTKKSKLQLKRNVAVDMAEECCSFSLSHGNFDFRTSDSEATYSSHLDKMTKDTVNVAFKHQIRKNGCTDTSAENRDTSATYQQVRHTKSKAVDRSYPDEDDILLASFLQNKSKKRRIEVTDACDQACSPLSISKVSKSFPARVEQLDDGNQLSSVDVNSQTLSHCNQQSSSELVGLDLVSGDDDSTLASWICRKSKDGCCS